MRILIISRATLFSAPGGDTIQITETAAHLRKLNVEVDIKLTNENINYSDYDLLHFFNIIRPADILSHTKHFEGKYVISPIFVDYGEYEKKVRPGFLKYVSRFLSTDTIEYLKSLVRALLNGERVSSLEYLLRGQSGSIKKLIKSSAILLPNSNNEYQRLVRRYKAQQLYEVVPNAISLEKFDGISTIGERADTVLCVARFEPLKNQINLIKAINQTNYKLILIGKASPNSQGYYEECKQQALDNPNIKFVDHIDQTKLVEFYSNAKVHVLASWFETTGLSTLEAAFCGCNIVITEKGDTTEYFGDYAYYCQPQSVESIVDAVDLAMNKPVNPKLKQMILKKYTWQETARKTLLGYNRALNE